MWRIWLALGAAGVVVLALAVWRIDAAAFHRGEAAREAIWQETSRKAEAERTMERQNAQRVIAAKDAELDAVDRQHAAEMKDAQDDLDRALAVAGTLPTIPGGVLAPLRRQSGSTARAR